MLCSLSELRNKEVVNLKTGIKIGYVDDVEIDTENSAVRSLIIYGRPRCMGLFGKDEDIKISCTEIKLIGEDTILVDFNGDTISTKVKTFSVENLLK